MKYLPFLFAVIFLAGGVTTSCRNYMPTQVHCDTCCDTCKADTTHHPCDTCTKPCDTCAKPCDTCNINRDSLSHAFEWSQFSIPGETNLTGCWVFGPNDILIVGNNLWHYDGVSFSLVPAFDLTHNSVKLNGALSGYSIFAFSKTDFWLVHGSDVLHTNDGKYFDDYRPGAVNACWGSSPNDVFIVGNVGHIAHWDGVAFTQMSSGTTTDLNSVCGTDHNHVWASGRHQANNTTVLVHYDGNQWNIDDLSNDNQVKQNLLFSVWSTDSTISHEFTTVSSAFVYRKTDNQAWRIDQSVPNQIPRDTAHRVSLQAIQGNNPNDLWVAGDWGYLSHWSGKTWAKYPALFDYTNLLYGGGQLSVRGNTVCIVGFKNNNSWVAIGTRKE
ncbi:MAG: hypothetical protein WCH46_07950 [bacterium]